MQEKGCEIRTFMPKFGCVNERRNQLHEVIRLSGMNLIISDNDHPLIIKVASIQSARMQVYFIDNEDFFRRKFTVTDADGNEFDDNEDRCIFYVRGVIETVRKLRWVPDIIHCHGWMSALMPLYVRKALNDDPFFKNAKLVYSIYDNAFQKPFSSQFAEKVPIESIQPADMTAIQGTPSFLDLSKLAVEYSDGIIQGNAQVDDRLLDIVRQSGKPFTVGSADDNYANYFDFYNTLLEQR